MKGITSIKVLSHFTFLFILFNLVYFLSKGMMIDGKLYIIIVFAGILSSSMKRKTVKYAVFIVFIVSPTFFINQTILKLFLYIIASVGLLYFYRDIDKYPYYYFYEQFKKTSIILIGILGFCVFTGKIMSILEASALYIILYCIASFIVLRSLMVIEYSSNTNNLSKINYWYSSIIVVSAFIFSINIIRNNLIKIVTFIINNIYELVCSIIYFLVKVVMVIIGPVLQWLYNGLIKISSSKKTTHINTKTNVKSKTNINYKHLSENISDSRVIYILLTIAIIVLIIVLLMKVFRKFVDKGISEEEYIEEKETIMVSNAKNRRLSKALINFFQRKNNNDYIRFYYVKYLRLCIKKQIKIKLCDTTQEINKKSDIYFNNEILESFRNKYIKVRYGNYQADNNILSKFKEEYKKIKNDSERYSKI